MSNACIFCDIIAGKLQACRLYEDDATVAFLDLRQSNRGHVLVLPKPHVVTLDQLPPALHAPLMATIVRMTRAVQACFKPDGVNIWQSNGEGANQEVPHVHMHVFARWKGDGHFQIYPQKVTDTPMDELQRLAERLRPFV